MHGPSAFRAAEAGALRQLLEPPPAGSPAGGGALAGVIALGGGTPTAPGVGELLRRHADARRIELVYLRATPATLRARLAGTNLDQRPSLTGAGVVDEVEVVFHQRDALYCELATLRLDTDAMTLAQAEVALVELLA